jgi:hypothetical protein
MDVARREEKKNAYVILVGKLEGKKNLVWLCRGHGGVFYVNTCTLTGNFFFQRIICMS